MKRANLACAASRSEERHNRFDNLSRRPVSANVSVNAPVKKW
jgi:hypothetical protein